MAENTKIVRMKELVEILNQAAKAYYQEAAEIMTNLEYDRLYDELEALERETKTTLSNSPTVRVGYEVLSELPKETHVFPMLSLDKTKEVEQLENFLGDKKGLLSWKLDGLTVVLTYREGRLEKAVTRGNGTIGEVITGNAKMFKNLPLTIPYTGELVLRGEAVICYSDFERMNAEIEDVDAKYKNPRNLCSGSVRQLNNEITAKRNVNFFAFALILAEGIDFKNSMKEQLDWLALQGFNVVEYKEVTASTIGDTVSYFAKAIETFDVPSDGLVLMFDDMAYGQSLGMTSKFPRNGLAFKWADETSITRLEEIEWSPSRTGLINPVAVFAPVQLEGTTVSRASLHNISIMEEMALGIGDEIEVYKANMIIPQIARNLTRSGVKDIPDKCPVCKMPTTIRMSNEVKSLYCTNDKCPAKKIKLFTHFVSRDAMNIDGLSEETLDKFIQAGYLTELADIFKLNRYEHEIVTTKGFGQKSYDNLWTSIERARETTLVRFIYSLGIPNIGLSNAKMLVKQTGGTLEALRIVKREELEQIDGIGAVIADAFVSYFEKEENNRTVDHLLEEIQMKQQKKENKEQIFDGKTFVITGTLNQFENRNQAKEWIESLGGKVTGSVSNKTDYLLNNDNMSTSSKNKKAKELNIPIITEEELLKMKVVSKER